MGKIIGLEEYKIKKQEQMIKEEELQDKKEYNDFIKMLQYYITVNVSQCNIVHIVPTDDIFNLYDGFGRLINMSQYEDMAEICKDSELNHDDFLLSSLLTLSPKRIILYNVDKIHSHLLTTIRDVFTHRIAESRIEYININGEGKA